MAFAEKLVKANTLFVDAGVKFDAQEHPAAAAKYKEAIEAYKDLVDTEAAEAKPQGVIRADILTNMKAAYNNAAFSYNQVGNFERAIEVLDEARGIKVLNDNDDKVTEKLDKVYHNFGVDLYTKAKTYFVNGNYPEAKKTLKEMLAIQEIKTPALLMNAYSLLAQSEEKDGVIQVGTLERAKSEVDAMSTQDITASREQVTYLCQNLAAKYLAAGRGADVQVLVNTPKYGVKVDALRDHAIFLCNAQATKQEGATDLINLFKTFGDAQFQVDLQGVASKYGHPELDTKILGSPEAFAKLTAEELTA
jgi:tetratricopeptide (TPR) repeat protein